MTCHEIESEIIDVARGVRSDPLREAAINRHVHSCSRCAGRLDTERALSAALRRLADSTAEPAPDPERETAILAAFDAVWERASTHRDGQTANRMVRGLFLGAAAVLLAVGAARLWTMVSRVQLSHRHPRELVTAAPAHGSPSLPESRVAHEGGTLTPTPSVRRNIRHRSARAIMTRPVSEFVPLPGAGTLPPLESGEMLRLSLPVSMLPSLGLLPPASSEVDVVSADVLVGQDGFARAVRLVP